MEEIACAISLIFWVTGRCVRYAETVCPREGVLGRSFEERYGIVMREDRTDAMNGVPAAADIVLTPRRRTLPSPLGKVPREGRMRSFVIAHITRRVCGTENARSRAGGRPMMYSVMTSFTNNAGTWFTFQNWIERLVRN